MYGGAHDGGSTAGATLGELSPHVYAIADAAYRQMRAEGKSQSILVRPQAPRQLGPVPCTGVQHALWPACGSSLL